jgi:hypothetical protein
VSELIVHEGAAGPAVYGDLWRTAAEIRAQVNRIQEVMKAVMKKDVHYGVITGTQKPTLYKAGSEVLLSTFRIAVELQVEDLAMGSGEAHYRVLARGRHQTSGIVIGEGIGECSSLEEKYRWRAAVCDEEFEETALDRRRVKYKKWNGKVDRVKQVRTEPADIANTVLKMAKKRAQIDLCLTGLAASDVFSQDIEDMPSELRDELHGSDDESGAPRSTKPATRAPQQRTPSSGGRVSGLATDKQVNLLRVKLERAQIEENALLAEFELGELAEMPFEKVNDALAWIANANA